MTGLIATLLCEAVRRKEVQKVNEEVALNEFINADKAVNYAGCRVPADITLRRDVANLSLERVARGGKAIVILRV